METPKENILFHKTWATIRTAWVFVIQWGAQLLGIYVSTPLVVLLGMLLLKDRFTFSQYVSTCHQFFSSVVPFIAVIAGIRFGWTFPMGVWYRHFLDQRTQKYQETLKQREIVLQKILDVRRKLHIKNPSSD
ncbi:hypothetical protein ACSSZE_12910 [Acidithiobacillus caldus]